MPAQIIDGRAIAQEIRAEVARRVRKLARRGVIPGLAFVLVGENPSSISYVRSKGDAAEETGIFSETYPLSESISQEQLISHILDVDEDRRFHAVLLQLPLPPHLDESAAINAIDPTKDVDGVTAVNLGRLLRGEPCPPAPPPLAGRAPGSPPSVASSTPATASTPGRGTPTAAMPPSP